MFADKPHRLNGRMRAAISCFDDLASGYRTRVGLPAQRAIAQRFRALARNRPERVTSRCLLLRVERTFWLPSSRSESDPHGGHQSDTAQLNFEDFGLIVVGLRGRPTADSAVTSAAALRRFVIDYHPA